MTSQRDAAQAATTRLHPRDMQTFLQFYVATGIMSMGAGATVHREINPTSLFDKYEYHIRLKSSYFTMIFVPVSSPQSGLFDEWKIDHTAGAHIDYYKKNPNAGYCSYIIRPKLAKLNLE